MERYTSEINIKKFADARKKKKKEIGKGSIISLWIAYRVV